ncbi:hypothetical protein CEP49_04815 [Mergibacter septicus]|uniref:Slam-dependent surface lipoprotein n=1 Tax=Mergibacter septicus TaxID=221402 RepID=UPI0011795128|nr:Slam-dependent surface lipoprotein [Mergibacter septicus]AWX13923.1 hypothetical protein CEP49_04815 [Mergibacter septicus]
MQLHKHYLAILLSASLTGCLSGGGSFDVEEVEPTKVINNPADKKVTYKQAEKPNPEDFSEMGATFNSPIPKNAFLKYEDVSKLFTLDPTGAGNKHIDEDYDMVTINYPVVINGESGKKLVTQEQKISLKTNGSENKWEYLTKQSKTTGTFNSGKAKFYYDNSDNSTILKLIEFDNTKVGLVRVRHTGDSYHLFDLEKVLTSNIFYRGKNKTTDVPISGTAKYSGSWEFATQLHFSDDNFPDGGNSNLTAENKAEFNVDFGQKTLTGSLKSNSDNRAKLDYTINATINGNGFAGTATGKYNFSDDNGSSDNHTATVSGSFFGKGAAELAGKAIADDNAWAGVFAAQKEKNGGTELQTNGDLFQAGVMTFTAVPSNSAASPQPASMDSSSASNSQSTTYQLDKYQKVNYSGNIDKLQVDGMLIDLTQDSTLNNPCCSAKEREENSLTTQSVKFGKYGYTKQAQNGESGTDSQNNSVGGYFVQGVLTPNSQVPTTGTSKYDGRWYGYASSEKGVFSGGALDAKFTAKWSEKKLEGNLFNKNQIDKASLNFEATITGNSFKTDKATTLNVSIDTSRDSQNDTKIMVNDVKVEGHFYGKNANELGGHFYSESQKAGGVFGAKQIETQSK